MKLVIRQYVESLRERGELDAILPDLLCELGYTVITRPKSGTRQYGVDIAAVGNDDSGVRKLFLFSLKQGDLTRTDWDASPQALRPSLDEIREIYLHSRVLNEHKSLPVVICLCFGGIVQEAVLDNVTGYIRQYESDTLSFETWNGDHIAGLLIKGVLKEHLLKPELRASFQKSVAMVDEPDICIEHFSELVRQLCAQEASSLKARVTIARQLYLCLWVLFVWARDANNVEGPYRASELTLLHCWHLLRGDIGKKGAASESAGLMIYEMTMLHFAIFDEGISKKILPHVGKRDAVANAVNSPSPVDINLKLFDLLGRIALHGLWRLWAISGDAGLPNVRDDWDDENIAEIGQKLFLLIRNNPTLLCPIRDDHSIEVVLTLMVFTMQAQMMPAAKSWVTALIDQISYAFRSHGKYPTIQRSYRELIRHPSERTDAYRQENTSGSTLIPILSLWAPAVGATDAAQNLEEFAAKLLGHCNCQLWFPDEDSEDRFYIDDDRHGATLCDVPIKADTTKALTMLKAECDGSKYFDMLSAIELGHWPVVLLACRHYRLPIPPQIWMGLLDDLGGLTDSTR